MVDISAGTSLQLACRDPHGDRLMWKKDGMPVNAGRYVITMAAVGGGASSTTLTITLAQPEDSGFYVCQSEEDIMENDGVRVRVTDSPSSGE